MIIIHVTLVHYSLDGRQRATDFLIGFVHLTQLNLIVLDSLTFETLYVKTLK